MSKIEKVGVTANPKDNNALNEQKSMEVEFDFPESTEEAVALWGEKVCFSKINAAVTVDLQGFIRRHMEKGKTEAQIKALLENVNADNPEAQPKAWAPGVSAVKKSKVERLLDKTADLTDEEFDAYVKSLRDSRQKKKAS